MWRRVSIAGVSLCLHAISISLTHTQSFSLSLILSLSTNRHIVKLIVLFLSPNILYVFMLYVYNIRFVHMPTQIKNKFYKCLTTDMINYAITSFNLSKTTFEETFICCFLFVTASGVLFKWYLSWWPNDVIVGFLIGQIKWHLPHWMRSFGISIVSSYHANHRINATINFDRNITFCVV